MAKFEPAKQQNNSKNKSRSLLEYKYNAKITDDDKNSQSLLEWSSHCDKVLHFFAEHKASGTLRDDPFLVESFKLCKELFQRDGEIITMDNYGDNELCNSYPIKIIFQKSFINHIQQHNNEDIFGLFKHTRFSRARCRFVVPVIFLPNNAVIARSATLSSTSELLLNKSTTVLYDTLLKNNESRIESPIGSDIDILRGADIKLLNHLNIKYIFDLMLENKKKVGFGGYGMKIASSEKADKNGRYRSFCINSIPYPGCDSKVFMNNGYNGSDLNHDWSHNIGRRLWDQSKDTELKLDNENEMKNDINWKQYKTWDIVVLTQNYLRLILDYLQLSFCSTFESKNKQKDNIGVLIHCISGWDRTPLWISLIRISLWADSVIHCDLNEAEILYLTLSYDWMAFTHQLGHRMKRGENIFPFTFYILQWITDHKYSIFYDGQNVNADTQRYNKLQKLYVLFNKIWNRCSVPKYGVNRSDDITNTLKNMIPVSFIKAKDDQLINDAKMGLIIQKLMDMGFDDKLAMKAAKKYPNDIEIALDYAIKKQHSQK